MYLEGQEEGHGLECDQADLKVAKAEKESQTKYVNAKTT